MSDFWTSLGHCLGGLVAGEGSFVVGDRGQRFVAGGTARLRFRFLLTMAARDRLLVQALRDFLDAGSIRERAASRPHWQPTVTLSIESTAVHKRTTIPFGERFLPEFCAKRRQFEAWRDRLLEYEQHRPTRYGRGPSTCKEPGCDRPVRGQGLCRRHYYRLTGY